MMRLGVASAALVVATLLADVPLAAGADAAGLDAVVTLDGHASNPFVRHDKDSARARVFLFVRTDCPITNRYAPELQRLFQEFSGRGAEFWLVYPDATTTAQGIQEQVSQYALPGTVLRDPRHSLVKLARVTIAPEAAVFDEAGRLIYHGRIDDRWISPGKSKPSPQVHDL
jgi:hypothetical protein